MKFSAGVVTAALVLAASTTTEYAQAFTTTNAGSVATTRRRGTFGEQHPLGFTVPRSSSTSALKMAAESSSYTVGIVGATGAVGKEIRQCLEKRDFPVSKLRIFGSERSAGKTIDTDSYGKIEVELFDVAKARECDVVFLAVSGDFALEHARALSDGDDGCVVIDNSVRSIHLFELQFLLLPFDKVYLPFRLLLFHFAWPVRFPIREGRTSGGTGN